MSLCEFTGKSVLVIDDEPMVREVVAAYLSRDGFMVEQAADGPTALGVSHPGVLTWSSSTSCCRRWTG
ncbi:MAG: hypothetical protein ACE5F5_05720 [Acidimicrobiia bacterium]